MFFLEKDTICFILLNVLSARLVLISRTFQSPDRIRRSRSCESPVSSVRRCPRPPSENSVKSLNLHEQPSHTPLPLGADLVRQPTDQSVSLFISPKNQLTRSLTTVRDSTVSSRLGQGTADWGTMSLSSLPSPAASGSARSLALPSPPGTGPTPAPATPGDAGGMEVGGLEVLLEPLSPPKISLLSEAMTISPLPSALRPSTLNSRLGGRVLRPGRAVLRSWGWSLWFC